MNESKITACLFYVSIERNNKIGRGLFSFIFFDFEKRGVFLIFHKMETWFYYVTFGVKTSGFVLSDENLFL